MVAQIAKPSLVLLIALLLIMPVLVGSLCAIFAEFLILWR